MTKEHFNQEVDKLKEEFGKRSLGPEKTKAYWRMFYDVSNDVFTDAVSTACVELRSAPAGTQMQKLVVEAKRNFEEARRGGSSRFDASQILASAFDASAGHLSPEELTRTRSRQKLVRDLALGKITDKQFNQGCAFYDSFLHPKKRPAGWPSGVSAQRSNYAGPMKTSLVCAECDGSGLIHTRDDKHREYVYKCGCPAAHQHHKDIPRKQEY